MAKNRKLPCSPLFIGVIAVILIMLIPLPPPAIVLCILIALNVVLAIVIFLIALFSKNITDFFRFPAVLLVSTIFGLAVNIFSARFILFKVDDSLIQAAVAFAAGFGITRLIIGYAGSFASAAFLIIVIIKCINRVRVAAALFILNTMQFKLMTVETEYSSGLITEEEAIIRKNAVQREGDFYNAMYETGEFISGSIKIAIFIMAATILGGIAFGVLLQGESFAGVVNTYIPLSIINGLYFLSQILLLSFAACRSVTRKIMTKKPKESPVVPSVVPVDTLLLEIGCGLVPLLEKEKGAELLEKVQDVRRRMAHDLGMVMPKVRILDNIILEPSEYCIKIKGVEAGRGEIRMGTVTDPASIIAAHLTEIIKHHAAEFADGSTAEAIGEIRKNEDEK